jgi:hypothetical protein
MIGKVIDGVKIYRLFWLNICDKFCQSLGFIGAYIFIAIILIFQLVLIAFFGLFFSMFSSDKDTIETVAIIMSSWHLLLTVDIFYRAAFYMADGIRSFVDRLRGR